MRLNRRIKHLFRSHERHTYHEKKCHCEGCYIDWGETFWRVFVTLGIIVVFIPLLGKAWDWSGFGKTPEVRAAEIYKSVETEKLKNQKVKEKTVMCKGLNKWYDEFSDDCVE